MVYEVRRSCASDRDLETLFDLHFVAYQELGKIPADAFEQAVARVLEIEAALEALGDVPTEQGTDASQIMAGLRHITKDEAIFYFTVDEVAGIVHVLAVFFNDQDHRSWLLDRIKAGML